MSDSAEECRTICNGQFRTVIDHAAKKRTCSGCGRDMGYSDDLLASHLQNYPQNRYSVPISMDATHPRIVQITNMCTRLGVPENIKEHAAEILTRVEVYYHGERRNLLFAACIVVACREYDMTPPNLEMFSADEFERNQIITVANSIARKNYF